MPDALNDSMTACPSLPECGGYAEHMCDKRSDDALLGLVALSGDTLNRHVKTVSGYGTMLERHLATQGDDLGSAYALEMRAGLERLSGLIRHIHNVTASDMTRAERAATIELIRAALVSELSVR